MPAAIFGPYDFLNFNGKLVEFVLVSVQVLGP